MPHLPFHTDKSFHTQKPQEQQSKMHLPHSSCKLRSEHDAVAAERCAILSLLSLCVISPIPFAIRTLLWHFGCFASPAIPSVCWVNILRVTDHVTSRNIDAKHRVSTLTNQGPVCKCCPNGNCCILELATLAAQS